MCMLIIPEGKHGVCVFSAARVHPAGHPRHGYLVSGQVRYGEDGRVCARNSTADRAGGGTG